MPHSNPGASRRQCPSGRGDASSVAFAAPPCQTCRPSFRREMRAMPNLIDLSIPVRHGDGRLGLEVAFSTPYSYETCGWQGSSFSMFARYATHVDAPNHFIEGAKGIDEAPIGRLMGAAALVPLDDHGAAKAITADTLEDRGRHVRRG